VVVGRTAWNPRRTLMTRNRKTSGRSVNQDVHDPRKGDPELDPERSDRDAGAGRPVQLDEEGRSRPIEADSPRPTDAGVVPE
jgi:hypothetical protein